MTTLDSMILDIVSIGLNWAFNGTVVMFLSLMLISGLLHAFWGILEGVDNRIFYPQKLSESTTTETEIETPLPNLERVEEDLNLVSKIESIFEEKSQQEQVESKIPTIKELKQMAKELKIKGYGSMTKKQLLEEIKLC